jgi:hypothetical protein
MRVFGNDQNADDTNDGMNADPDDIAAWMAQRQQELANRDQNIAAGQNAWAASTASGDNLTAPNPDDVRALGADAQGQDAAAAVPPVKRGDKGSLSDNHVTGSVFNETRSFSGPALQQAQINAAHVIINGDEKWGPKRANLASSASVVAHPLPGEESVYKSAQDAVAIARAQRAKGIDPTNGALHLNSRGDASRGSWNGSPIKTQVGPLHNSYTKGDTPWPTIYANTYQEE